MNKASWRDLLILIRAPLSVTAMTDCLCAALLVTQGFKTDLSIELILICIISFCSYSAGMGLNDIFDLERDRTLAPKRPLPSGRVSMTQAWALCLSLLAIALSLTLFLSLRAGLAVLHLFIAIFLYDAWLKHYRIPGSIAMALCRVANIYLAITLVSPDLSLLEIYRNPGPAHAYAWGNGLYIFALTWHSTYEDEEAPKLSLVLIATLLVAAVIGLVVGFAFKFAYPGQVNLWLVLVFAGALIFNIGWRMKASFTLGTLATAGLTTKWLIRGLPLLGALSLSLQGLNLAAFLLLLGYFPYILGAKMLFRPPPAANPSVQN